MAQAHEFDREHLSVNRIVDAVVEAEKEVHVVHANMRLLYRVSSE